MSFTHEDVQRLVQLLDSSHFDELHLEAEGIKLSLRRNGAAPSLAPAAALPAPVSVKAPLAPAPAPVSAPAPAVLASAPAIVGEAAGLLEIRSPMLGTFYGAPKPGAAPFVSPGTRVTPDTVVGIIEVMKLMNSIPAGIDGVIAESLIRDGDLVEFDQVLMRVRPA